MFKELKILKLSLFAIFLAIIIWRVSESNKLSVFFTEGSSHRLGSKIEIFQAGNFNADDEFFSVNDLFGNNAYVDVFNYVNNLQENKSGIEFPMTNKKQITLPDTCKSGIYLLNEEYSLVMQGEKGADITIVYPYANNMIYQDDGSGTILSNEIVEFNLNAPVLVDEYSKGLKDFFKFCSNNYSVNYITDIELENKELYATTKLIIVYGRSSFYSPLMKNNIAEYSRKGGNILLMSSSFSANAIWVDKNKVKFSEMADDFQITSWLALEKDIRKDFGLSNMFGGKANTIKGQSYQILNKNHALFEGIENSEVPLSGEQYLGGYCGWTSDSIPYAKQLHFYSNELLAYNLCTFGDKNKNIGGIYLIQPDSTSGKVLSLGTEDWSLEKNQKNKVVFQITKNALKLMLK